MTPNQQPAQRPVSMPPEHEGFIRQLVAEGQEAVEAVYEDVEEIASHFWRHYAVFAVGIGILVGLIVASALIDNPAKGSLLHILERIIDAGIGGMVIVMFLAATLAGAKDLIAPNIDMARKTVARIRTMQNRGAPVSEAEGRVAQGIFQRNGLVMLGIAIGMVGFGLFL